MRSRGGRCATTTCASTSATAASATRDLHQARNDWRNTVYPCIPGHEIVGQVAAVGPSVKRYKAGDWVAVGCLVDSCRECSECNAGREVFCQKGSTLTYNGKDRQTGEITFGGYSSHIVVREEFVLRMPDGLDPARAAPLLCAGITTYSPLRHWQGGPGFEGGGGGSRRSRSHGREACQRHGRRSDGAHAFRGQGRRGEGAWRAPRAAVRPTPTR